MPFSLLALIRSWFYIVPGVDHTNPSRMVCGDETAGGGRLLGRECLLFLAYSPYIFMHPFPLPTTIARLPIPYYCYY